jgi:hypothetical protein
LTARRRRAKFADSVTRRPIDAPGETPDGAGESAAARRIVDEELAILGRVREVVGRAGPAAARIRADYDADLVELRDELAEAKPEDLAPLVEQMTRIASLAAGRRNAARSPVDPGSPYFAHLRLDEQGKVRDVLIGKVGLIDRAANVQIVDWRDAPVSQIYYRYDEGDDFDETVDGCGGSAARRAPSSPTSRGAGSRSTRPPRRRSRAARAPPPGRPRRRRAPGRRRARTGGRRRARWSGAPTSTCRRSPRSSTGRSSS